MWYNGDEYNGNYENDKMSGNGKLTSKSKMFTYEGNFTNGVFEGKGTYNNEKEGWTYVGLFHNGKQDGEGTFYDKKGKSNKVIYENGEFKSITK